MALSNERERATSRFLFQNGKRAMIWSSNTSRGTKSPKVPCYQFKSTIGPPSIINGELGQTIPSHGLRSKEKASDASVPHPTLADEPVARKWQVVSSNETAALHRIAFKLTAERHPMPRMICPPTLLVCPQRGAEGRERRSEPPSQMEPLAAGRGRRLQGGAGLDHQRAEKQSALHRVGPGRPRRDHQYPFPAGRGGAPANSYSGTAARWSF